MSLLETLVSMALTLALGGIAMSLVAAGQTIARTQPEAADLHQRARVAVQAIERELRDAGAGIERGPMAGPLRLRFPPVTPVADGLTLWSATNRDAQGSPAFAVEEGATLITLQPSIACPPGQAACAFTAGTSAIAFTAAGCRTTLRIGSVSGDALSLASPLSGCALDATSIVAEGTVHTFHLDASGRQLIRRDEATGSANPMVDGVATMTVACFADLAAAEAISGSSDAELMRARRVRLTLRFVPTNPLLRIPDFSVTVDVAPVNLSGA